MAVTKRSTKGAALTHAEVDANWDELLGLLSRLGKYIASPTPGANQIPVLNTSGFFGSVMTFAAGLKLGTGSAILANYEIGTWTPIIVGTSVAGNHAYATLSGYYTRIGRVVFLSARIILSSKDAAMSGSVVVQGLPFAVPAVPTTQHAATIAFVQNLNYPTTAGYFLSVGFSANTSNITLYINKANQVMAFFDSSWVTSTSEIAFSGYYIL